MQNRADLLFEGVAAGLRIKAANTDNSAIGGPQTLEDLDGTRFPRAIGAEQAEDLTFVDRETDAAKGVDGALAFRQVMDIDNWRGHGGQISIAHSAPGANSRLRIAVHGSDGAPPKNHAPQNNSCNGPDGPGGTGPIETGPSRLHPALIPNPTTRGSGHSGIGWRRLNGPP